MIILYINSLRLCIRPTRQFCVLIHWQNSPIEPIGLAFSMAEPARTVGFGKRDSMELAQTVGFGKTGFEKTGLGKNGIISICALQLQFQSFKPINTLPDLHMGTCAVVSAQYSISSCALKSEINKFSQHGGLKICMFTACHRDCTHGVRVCLESNDLRLLQVIMILEGFLLKFYVLFSSFFFHWSSLYWSSLNSCICGSQFLLFLTDGF